MISEKPKILIIDDEEVVLDSCKAILRNQDFDLTTVSNGELGLELINRIGPDLVFVDLKMPGLSGFEVIKRIKEVDPNIITIVITGFSTVSSAVEAMKIGAYDFLPKPFTPDEFRLITNRGIDKRKLVLETIKLKKEKEILKENFAAIVSHELKSPLGVVQQNIYILEEELKGNITKDQFLRLEKMKNKVNDLINLIHTWLRVISVDVNRLKDDFKMISLDDVIAKAVENHQSLASKKGVQINVNIEGIFSPYIGDEGTLVEAIGNLLGNAIKFSQFDSQIIISGKENSGSVELSVMDTGIGISEEDKPYIFDDFFTTIKGDQVERSSGLGLAITRRIIEAHNGTISVNSDLGKGSTFVIHLPINTKNVNINKERSNTGEIL